VSPQTADPAYATTVTLKGAGFQSIKNGHGGIYVLFGWVSEPAGGAWKPSKGGAPGTTLRYVQDRESKDNLGYQRFVAFPDGDTSSSANGGVIAEDGTWSAQLNIPGARFKAADRAGKVSDVDCTQTQCGIITIGAHGVVNANNETFTPVSFAVPTKQAPAPPPTQAPPATTAPTTAAPTTTATTTSTPTSSSTTTDTSALQVEQAAQATESTSPNWLLIAVLAAVVLAAVTALVWWRRHRARGEQ
jgi:hypothetical protein